MVDPGTKLWGPSTFREAGASKGIAIETELQQVKRERYFKKEKKGTQEKIKIEGSTVMNIAKKTCKIKSKYLLDLAKQKSLDKSNFSVVVRTEIEKYWRVSRRWRSGKIKSSEILLKWGADMVVLWEMRG